MVAVPVPFPVHRDQQQVRTLERLEPVRGVGPSQRVVAQRRTQALEWRRAHQELHLLVGQPVQQLGSEVFADEPVASGDDRRGSIGTPVRGAHRQGSQVEAGGPALGSRIEFADLAHRATLAGSLEEGHRLVVVEPEVVALQEYQTLCRDQARDRQALDRARRDRHLGPGREMRGQGHDDVERLLVVQPFEIVEHEQERRLSVGDRRAQCGNGHRPDRWADTAGREDLVVADPDRPVDRHRHVAQQDGRVVVPFVELEPDRLSRRRRRPFGQDGRLAISGGRGQDDQWHPRPSLQPFDEARARDEA